MPVRTDQLHELQTLNVSNLRTNLYGNLDIRPFKGKETESIENSISKSLSLEIVNKYIKNGSGHKSMDALQSPDDLPKNGSNGNGVNNGSQFKKHWFVPVKNLNRYDSVASSGYGSIVDFHSVDSLYHETTLVEEPDDANGHHIDSRSLNTWPSSPDVLSSLDGASSYDVYSTTPSISPLPDFQTSSSPSTSSSPLPAHDAKPQQKRNEYIRLVHRFGDDMKDTCLFPLALPMDGSDVYKGATTWESLSAKADCVLIKWEESAKRNRRVINRVLPDSTKYFCPNLELEGSLFRHPEVNVPMRRTKSELDLYKLGFHERTGLITSAKRGSKKTSSDDINLTVSNEKGRQRAYSSLSVRKNYVHFSAKNDRKNDHRSTNKKRRMSLDPKSLVQSIRIENPISLALQITKIEKELFLNLPTEEMMSAVIKRGKSFTNSGIKKLVEFGQLLSQFVANIIVKEPTPEAQGKKIAAIIEVACVLRKLRNWQSLSDWLRGLQLVQVYRMSAAWSHTKQKYPVHFNDYIKLSRVVRFDTIAILRSRQPSIPSLSAFVSLLGVRCLATWDRLEIQPKWLEPPSLVGWLEREMIKWVDFNDNKDNNKDNKKDSKPLKGKKIKNEIQTFNQEQRPESHLEKCLKELTPERASLLPLNDPIYFIEDDQLPHTWTSRSVRNIPASYQSKIIRCFKNSYKIEMANISRYDTNT